MTIAGHLDEFHGLPCFAFPGIDDLEAGASPLPSPESVAWRVGVDAYDATEQWQDAFARFLATVDTTRVRALVVGAWNDVYENGPEDVVKALVTARQRLPALRGLFFGDIVFEEAEISWITQGDVGPLLNTFPELEEFGVRGGSGLVFPAVRHARLRKLDVETGGMPAAAVRGVAASDLPALVDLDLWLGTPEYGGDAEIADLEPFFAGTRLPSLKRLALHNSEIQDAICVALASAPVVARLTELDVSMGVLTDEGATALLAGQPLTHLTKLDLHHNWVNEALRARLVATLEPAGVEVDVDPEEEEQDEDDDEVWRFVSVGE
ncbi:MAG TPA: STM4015 family protein [Streptomyces sp.]|nr:STM4015 family protein [Streptomyces sp.]